MKNILAPSILSADFKILGEQLKLTEEAGAEYIHFDVMDGMVRSKHFLWNACSRIDQGSNNTDTGCSSHGDRTDPLCGRIRESRSRYRYSSL